MTNNVTRPPKYQNGGSKIFKALHLCNRARQMYYYSMTTYRKLHSESSVQRSRDQ